MLITSKYDGTCTSCGGRISAGDRVSWIKGVRGVTHAACSSEGKAVAVAVAASRAESADIDIPLPDGLSLYPYQRAGVAYMVERPGVLQGDEMGLGKTVQCLAALNVLGEEAFPCLVVCPKSLALNWKREAEKWLIGRSVSRGWQTTDVTVVTFEEAKKLLEQLTLTSWGTLIVDEAHLVKNPKTQRSKCIRELRARARRVWCLTGTPVPNKPVELHPLLALVAPDEWDPNGKGFFRFAMRYCDAHKERVARNKEVWIMTGSSNLDELNERLRATCMVRRLKADVLTELPAKVRQVIELPANGSAKAIAAERKAVQPLDGETFEQAVQRLAECGALGFTEMSRVRREVAIAKVPAVIEHCRTFLESEPGLKLCVWAHHHAVIDAITEGLSEFGAAKLTGETSTEERQRVVDAFQTDPSVRVFVGSIQAGGVGLTLTAAHHAVFAELDWVPGNVTQAEDRCHRIGQRESVLVQHLVMEGSIDAHLARIIVAKQAIADSILDEEHKAPAPPGPDSGSGGGAHFSPQVEHQEPTLPPELVQRVHDGLRKLAGMCDGARQLDGCGFNKMDSDFGRSLAAHGSLSNKQAQAGLKLCRKYGRQLQWKDDA